ncbi:hypothetical protein AcV5_006991 [Taiwanofungus camphoratus]|nr:hypothetical protein AcV5_006991 [Antrodia cinnamomea]
MQIAPCLVLLKRDGVLILVLNILDIVLYVTNVFTTVTSCFIAPLTSIIISRCILNLRHVQFSMQSEVYTKDGPFVGSNSAMPSVSCMLSGEYTSNGPMVSIVLEDLFIHSMSQASEQS